MALSYQEYLRLDVLLSAQHPRSDEPEHDEMLFIIIHQVFELWFKQTIHELKALRTALSTSNNPDVFHALKRVLAILKTLVSQIDILETMTPISFNSFRERLERASGLQSFQFRQVEFLLGKKSTKVLDRYRQQPQAHAELSTLFSSPTIWDAFLQYLSHNNYTLPEDQLKRDVTQSLVENPDVQAVLIEVYRNQGQAMQVCERLVDFDEGLQEWRYRHVKMVERTIGDKKGTGGSSGVEYLRQTLFHPVFPDLWAIRSQL